MATQTGITVAGPNQPFTAVNDIPRPVPGSKQLLVRVLAVGINPVEPMQQHSGLLVNEWPAVLGSDYAGVVIDVGPECTNFQPGDHVFSCAPLGQNSLTPFQETLVADEDVVFRKPENLSLEECCTIGAGLLTASLCLLAGAGLKVSDDGTMAPQRDEWIVVLGGTGSVGQFGVQLGRLCGYKVLASCSPSKKSVALRAGASETFNSRGTVAEQVHDIKRITHGNFSRMFDATAHGYQVMIDALEHCSLGLARYLTTVDDWSEFNTPADLREYRAELGHLCRREEAMGAQVTRDIAGWIPALERHLAAGTIRPVEHQVVEGAGWKRVVQAIQDFEAGKFSKKAVVRVEDEGVAGL